MRIPIPVLVLAVLLPAAASAQADSAAALSQKTVSRISSRYDKVNADIDRQTEKMLAKMQRQEDKLNKRLQKIDSSKAARIFNNTAAVYQSLVLRLQTPVSPDMTTPLRQYFPGFDSLQTAFKFFGQYGGNPQQFVGVTGQMQALQGTLIQSGAIQVFLSSRQQQLQNELGQYNLGGQLLGMNKQLFYYQQQMAQYKALVNDPEKLGEAVLSQAMQLPMFQSFFQRNSYLAQLFGPPGQDAGGAKIAPGQQTKAQVQQLISQHTAAPVPGMSAGAGGADASGMMQQQMQGATQQLASLQSNVAALGGGGGSSDEVMPDFKPNMEKTKTFLKRLEYGISIQNTQSTGLMPSLSTLTVTLGYKLRQDATVGIGASYILGVGQPPGYIQFSSQGAGLLSYVDIKAKKSWWVTGGLQANYLQEFGKLSDLDNNITAWQGSALLGLTKKYKIGANKNGSIQLLYDFLYRQHVPQSQPLIFRMGYSF